MVDQKNFDVIIIGGSYAGLSAAMSLGRALRKVLIIDSGKPCNEQTPHSHNFITQDGKTPQEISRLGKKQVEKYETVQFLNGTANAGVKIDEGFEIEISTGESFKAKKIIFATGLKDTMPPIKGFAECWGISSIHCPYCHGYEYSHRPTGIFANGDIAFEFGKLISNWTKDLTLFTNGKATLSEEQLEKLSKNQIRVVETEIDHFEHKNGYLENVVFQDKSKQAVTAIYAKPKFEQHSDLPKLLGCELTEQGHIKIDPFQKTTVEGIYACGDNSSLMRAVSYAVATGTVAGAMANHEIIEQEF